MKWLKDIKKWSDKKKRIFAVSLALFITILAIVLNVGINVSQNKNKINTADRQLDSVGKSFIKIFTDVQPIIESVFSSTTKEKINKQILIASSSFSSSTNIVK